METKIRHILEDIKIFLGKLFIYSFAAFGLSCIIYFGYYVWRLQHPTAPFWTFFFSGN